MPSGTLCIGLHWMAKEQTGRTLKITKGCPSRRVSEWFIFVTLWVLKIPASLLQLLGVIFPVSLPFCNMHTEFRKTCLLAALVTAWWFQNEMLLWKHEEKLHKLPSPCQATTPILQIPGQSCIHAWSNSIDLNGHGSMRVSLGIMVVSGIIRLSDISYSFFRSIFIELPWRVYHTPQLLLWRHWGVAPPCVCRWCVLRFLFLIGAQPVSFVSLSRQRHWEPGLFVIVSCEDGDFGDTCS